MTPGAIMLLLLAALAALARIRRLIVDTTLQAPWRWAVVSVVGVCGVELVVAWTAPDSGDGLRTTGTVPIWAVAARFAAAVTTFCPLMAICGAKRPQDRAWSLIVLTLWIVLVVPAGELLLLGRGTRLEVQGLRAWFLVLLLFMGWANFALTRFWLAGTFAAFAQIGLLAEHWPLFGRPISGELRVGAIGFGVVALILASCWRPARTASHPLDRVWLDFRDLFGLLWSLRIAERVNAASTQCGWGVTLEWRGFRRSNAGALGLGQHEASDRELEQASERTFRHEALEQALEQTVWNLCQRFVSRDWFDKRRA